MTDIKSLNYDELVTYMAGLGEKKFRASQLYQWMHEKLADSFDECTNLSNALRQKLKETSEYVCLEPVRVQHSKLDGTEKYLFRLSDGNYVESVLRGWYDANIISVEDAKNSFVARKDRYSIYRSVLNQLGFSNRQPTDSEKEIIDIWIDKYNFSPELISYACSKSINTPNPSISYINGIIENWYSKDITTLEDVKKEEEEFRANKQKEITKTKTETKNHNYNNNYNKDRTPKVVTRYHNSFNEHFRKYSEDELEAKLLRVQNSKKAK